MLSWLVRVFFGLTGLFLLFVSALQISDGFVGYGLVSIGLGSLCCYLVFRSIRKGKNF